MMKLAGFLIVAMIALLAIAGCLGGSDSSKKSTASADTQSFGAGNRTIEINIPYTAESGELSSGDSLQLIKPGTTKPIIGINLWDSATYQQIYPTFQEFAESFIGKGHSFEMMKTNDGKPMLFSAVYESTDREGEPVYAFSGYIDDSKEHGEYVVIHAPNKVLYKGKTIATYTKDQFVAICQSFTIK